MANRFWILITGVLGFGLLSIIILQLLKETGNSNSYALLAESFLNGKFSTLKQCFDEDCISYAGKTFIIFPPIPAVLTMPFVAIFGTQFSGFIAISLVLFLASGFVWWKIIRKLGKDKQVSFLFIIAILFSTPLFFTTLRGDRVWFFAQTISFFSLSLALFYVLDKKNAFIAGVLIGCSFLSRQMTILVAPFIFAILIEDGLPLFKINRDRIKKFTFMAIPIAIAIGIYFSYNYMRFGNIMDTGYQYLIPSNVGDGVFMRDRILDLGIFNSDYFLFNFFYLFLQGFHVDFVGQYLNTLGQLDDKGSSILAASPFLFFLAITPIANKLKQNISTSFSLRVVLIGIFVSLLMIGFTLFYHSNGFSQYNVQRYTLDWLPIAFIILATSLKNEHMPIFGAIVSYGIILNFAAVAVLFLAT